MTDEQAEHLIGLMQLMLAEQHVLCISIVATQALGKLYTELNREERIRVERFVAQLRRGVTKDLTPENVKRLLTEDLSGPP